jgi:hypothetical protein
MMGVRQKLGEFRERKMATAITTLGPHRGNSAEKVDAHPVNARYNGKYSTRFAKSSAVPAWARSSKS